ncbi:MAG: HNH endonuclease [Thermodesulfovibrionales bacterium]
MNKIASRKKWSLKIRQDVLLRCFFRCTRPGCNNLAQDLHHVVLWSKGGSDLSSNIIGLCKKCHIEVHTRTQPVYHAERDNWLSPLAEANLWLAQQIENCPVRLDNITRSVLFEEVEKATCSLDAMNHHSQAIYSRNHWCTYEVFLKAAWAFLCEEKRDSNLVAAVLLLKMVQLYRRRPGKEYQKAAQKHLLKLKSLLSALDNSVESNWIRGVVGYEEAYIAFLRGATSIDTEALFRASENLEKLYGRKIGLFVSRAQMIVARMRRLALSGSHIVSNQNDLLKIQDNLSGYSDGLSKSWVDYSIPVHLAYGDLVQGKNKKAEERIAGLASQGVATSLWYRGVARLRMGELAIGTTDLVEARRAFYRDGQSERRSNLLVALGDAFILAERKEDARSAYSEALKQPEAMDNYDARQVARVRILNLNEGQYINNPTDIYFS